MGRLLRRFGARGVFWRQLLLSGVWNTPYFLEPPILRIWALLFMAWTSGRRGIMANLEVIRPGASYLSRLAGCYQVLWNFACNINDTARFRHMRIIPDWEFSGREHFDRLAAERNGAIVITAHMGNYDLGAFLFSETVGRTLYTVRAPEVEPETQQFETRGREQIEAGVRVDYSRQTSTLALDLVAALRNGEVVAIQGDRLPEGLGSFPARLFGREVQLPLGPFALAMATGVSIYPLVVVRLGRRNYRVHTESPIRCERTGRDRNADFSRAIGEWAAVLERVISAHWQQWYEFEPFFREGERS